MENNGNTQRPELEFIDETKIRVIPGLRGCRIFPWL